MPRQLKEDVIYCVFALDLSFFFALPFGFVAQDTFGCGDSPNDLVIGDTVARGHSTFWAHSYVGLMFSAELSELRFSVVFGHNVKD